MTKYRITVFSPIIQSQQEILTVLEKYFRKYSGKIETQTYSRLNEPPTKEQLGHWGDNGNKELATILDRQISPHNPSVSIEQARKRYNEGLRASFELSKILCYEKSIPYIVYRGEMERGKRERFERKIQFLRDKVLKKKLEII